MLDCSHIGLMFGRFSSQTVYLMLAKLCSSVSDFAASSGAAEERIQPNLEEEKKTLQVEQYPKNAFKISKNNTNNGFPSLFHALTNLSKLTNGIVISWAQRPPAPPRKDLELRLTAKDALEHP